LRLKILKAGPCAPGAKKRKKLCVEKFGKERKQKKRGKGGKEKKTIGLFTGHCS
jgi:hypothetical protein